MIETGEVDRIFFLDGNKLCSIRNEVSCHSLVRITGAGCISNTLIAAVSGALLLEDPGISGKKLAKAAIHAVAGLVQAGCRAERMAPGIGTFRIFLFDELGRLASI